MKLHVTMLLFAGIISFIASADDYSARQNKATELLQSMNYRQAVEESIRSTVQLVKGAALTPAADGSISEFKQKHISPIFDELEQSFDWSKVEASLAHVYASRFNLQELLTYPKQLHII